MFVNKHTATLDIQDNNVLWTNFSISWKKTKQKQIVNSGLFKVTMQCNVTLELTDGNFIG